MIERTQPNGELFDAQQLGSVLIDQFLSQKQVDDLHLGIVVGGTYEYYQGGKYIVLGIIPSATRYEEKGEVSYTVLELQCHEGNWPIGTIWPRDADDFTAKVEAGDQIVAKFTLVKDPRDNK